LRKPAHDPAAGRESRGRVAVARTRRACLSPYPGCALAARDPYPYCGRGPPLLGSAWSPPAVPTGPKGPHLLSISTPSARCWFTAKVMSPPVVGQRHDQCSNRRADHRYPDDSRRGGVMVLQRTAGRSRAANSPWNGSSKRDSGRHRATLRIGRPSIQFPMGRSNDA
jgi:hypothetical protein